MKKKTKRIRRREGRSKYKKILRTIGYPSSVGLPVFPSVSVHPVVQRFFYIPAFDIPLVEDLVIVADQFVNDRDEVALGFPDYGQAGYFNLYINGLLQEGITYNVATRSVTIIPTGQTILAGTPIILESVGFIVNVY